MSQPAIFVALKPNTNINASAAHDTLTHVIYTLRNCASFANLVVEAAQYPSRAFSNMSDQDTPPLAINSRW